MAQAKQLRGAYRPPQYRRVMLAQDHTTPPGLCIRAHKECRAERISKVKLQGVEDKALHARLAKAASND